MGQENKNDTDPVTCIELPSIQPLQMVDVIESLAQKKDLDPAIAMEAFSRFMDGELSQVQSGAFLLGLRAKGEAPQELEAAAIAVLERATPLPPITGTYIDIVGTGGDGKFSFNCSTATALTIAGIGHRVLKHGNRSISSRCGSADVLEQIGIPLNTPPQNVPQKLDQDHFVFLFAPEYHPAFQEIMPLRRDLGVRTLFNILGPLVNPGKPTHRLLGAPKSDIMELMAKTLARTGTTMSAVVCGAGGYDELTTLGKASVIFVTGHEMQEAQLDPTLYGFSNCDEKELMIEGPEHAAIVLRDLLQGIGSKAMLEMLAFNTGLALYLLDQTPKTINPIYGYDHQRMIFCMEEAKKAVKTGAGKRFIQNH